MATLNFAKVSLLACPRCHSPLKFQNFTLFDMSTHKGLKKILSKIFYARPSLSLNIAAKKNYSHLCKLLESKVQSIGLVIGCGEGGSGIENLLRTHGLRLVFSDVRWTSGINILCDGHQLPFCNESFDLVVIQGVLEHVFDYVRVADEVTRVLKDDGLIYCEFPFLQPNHGGAFDFTRLTYMGHRRLWRHFEQIDAGACGGPGMALAHMTKAFMRSLFRWKLWQKMADFITDWTLWWLKCLDLKIAKTPAGLDSASGYYFIGRKVAYDLSDDELTKFYRGAQ
ncbi:MAG: class I SAM-dependent methyltransferase [Nitrospirota bacterium]